MGFVYLERMEQLVYLLEDRVFICGPVGNVNRDLSNIAVRAAIDSLDAMRAVIDSLKVTVVINSRKAMRTLQLSFI